MSNINAQYSKTHQVARKARCLVDTVTQGASQLTRTNETAFDLKPGDPSQAAGWNLGSYSEMALDPASGEISSFRATLPHDLFSRASSGSLWPDRVSMQRKDGQPEYRRTNNFGLTSTCVTLLTDKTWLVEEKICGFPRKSYVFSDLRQPESELNWRCLKEW